MRARPAVRQSPACAPAPAFQLRAAHQPAAWGRRFARRRSAPIPSAPSERTLRALRQEDHAGAGAPDRAARLGKGLQLGNEAPALGDVRHRRRLAAGDDEAGEACELLLGAHLDGLDVLELGEQCHVLAEAALEREDADAHAAGQRRRRAGAGLLLRLHRHGFQLVRRCAGCVRRCRDRGGGLTGLLGCVANGAARQGCVGLACRVSGA
jgi:hypothetical protein